MGKGILAEALTALVRGLRDGSDSSRIHHDCSKSIFCRGVHRKMYQVLLVELLKLL
jgi:hypothetical protein